MSSTKKPLEDFLHELESRVRREEFRPLAYYNETGDALEIYASAEPHVAERIDPLVTVFVSAQKPERVVGLVLKDIRKHFGASGISKVLVNVHRATIRLLVHGALVAYEATYARKRGAEANWETTTANRTERLYDVLRDIRATEIDLTSVREALLQHAGR